MVFHTLHLVVVIFSDWFVGQLRFFHIIVVMIVGDFYDNGYGWLFSSAGLAACACLDWSHYIRSSFKVWVDKWMVSNGV